MIPCDCHECTVANTGKVVFPDTIRRAGYELHGVEAQRHEAARLKALEILQTVKAKLAESRGGRD